MSDSLIKLEGVTKVFLTDEVETHALSGIHMDIKKLAKIPPGGGWRVNGRGAPGSKSRKVVRGYAYVHSAIDAHSRLAYSEIHANEQAITMLGF